MESAGGLLDDGAMSFFGFGNLTISDIERYLRGLEPWAGWAAPIELLHDASGTEGTREGGVGVAVTDRCADPRAVKSACSSPAKQAGR
jgi:hypothetical protein